MHRILILSCNTGEGHNSAAKAVAEAAQRAGVEAKLADPVSFGSERAQSWVASCYNNMIKKAPALFGAVYKVGDLYSSTRIKSPVYFANALYAKNLAAYLRAERFDAVICTHLYGMEAMTAVDKREGLRLPCYGVLTDYTCIPFFPETALAGYFIPHPDLTAEMVKKGIPADRIYPTGIPVSARFCRHTPQNEARAALGLPPDGRLYLVMSGGVGCGNITALCDALIRSGKGDFSVCVLTGRNEQLARELSGHSCGGRVTAVPFTDQVPLYMSAADVLLSKAGGLSSTEAAVAQIPFVQVLAIPGCETKNAAFFSERGMSLRADSVAQAAEAAHLLACDSGAAEQMRRRQRENIRPDAADEIIRQVIS